MDKITAEKEFKKGLEKLKNNFNLSKDEAEKLEQLYRNETAHFSSGQFRKTLSPGMEKFSSSFPYGWKSLNEYFWKKYPQHKPIGTSTHVEGGTGKDKTFLIFPDLYSAMSTVLHNARMKGGNFYAWFSNDLGNQMVYKNRLNSIIPRITKDVFV